jgi:large subunit ribosomal protein L15
MSAILSNLSPPAGARTSEKRVGRGIASRLGKTCGRGQKGQKARNGGNIGKLHFQGGQTPIQRRVPKRGFNVPFPVKTLAIDVTVLARFDEGSVVDEAALRAAKVVKGRDKVRIRVIGNAAVEKKLIVKVDGFSKAAAASIEAVGGTAEVIAQTASSED